MEILQISVVNVQVLNLPILQKKTQFGQAATIVAISG